MMSLGPKSGVKQNTVPTYTPGARLYNSFVPLRVVPKSARGVA